MKEITRTIPTTTIHATVVVFKDNELTGKDLAPLVIVGEEVKKENAMKHVQKAYGKENSYAIKKVDVVENVYEISIADFMKSAKIVETATQEKTKTPATPESVIK